MRQQLMSSSIFPIDPPPKCCRITKKTRKHIYKFFLAENCSQAEASSGEHILQKLSSGGLHLGRICCGIRWRHSSSILRRQNMKTDRSPFSSTVAYHKSKRDEKNHDGFWGKHSVNAQCRRWNCNHTKNNVCDTFTIEFIFANLQT